jgi:hypothetical protein
MIFASKLSRLVRGRQSAKRSKNLGAQRRAPWRCRRAEVRSFGDEYLFFVTKILACCEIGESRSVEAYNIDTFEIGASRIDTPNKAP